MPQHKNKRRKDKSSSHGQQHESTPDSGSLNRKTKSPVRSHVPSQAVSENSVQSVTSSNEPLRVKSENSDVLNPHSSVCGQENAPGNNSSSSSISSSLLKTILDEEVNMSKYNTQLNERTKCSNCMRTNILIRVDIDEFKDYLLKVLEEKKKLEVENLSLKSENAKLTDELKDLLYHLNLKSQQVDAGQSNSLVYSYPDSANLDNLNTVEMETEEGASAVTEIEPCSSPNHQTTWESSKNDYRSDNREYETLGNGFVASSQVLGDDSSLPQNTGSWYEESIAASGDQDWTENSGAGEAPQDDTGTEATADEEHQGNPKEFRRGSFVHGGDPNGEKHGWRSQEYRNRSGPSGDRGGRRRLNRSGDRGGQQDYGGRRGPNRSGDRGGQHDHGGRGRPNRSGDRGGQHDHGGRGRLNRSGDRGGQRDYGAGGGRGGGKYERTYKIVQERFGDLFMAPEDYSLAHCVAEDMRMGSGIAVTFRQMFKNVDTLVDQGKRSGQVAVLEDKGRYIYYLVTKKVSNGKPRLSDLVSSVEAMKEHCVEKGVTKIAMPRIGCGLDRLEWSTVKNVLEDKFADTNVQITVYNFQQGPDEPETPVQRSRLYVRQELMNLVSIEAGTGLVFLGTEDSHVDPTIESLNTKYRFLHDYKTCNKRVGDVVKFEKNGEFLYGLIVKKNANDRFSYVTLNKCLCKFRDMIWKDRYEYFGMEAFIVDDDDLTVEKTITLLKNVFFSKKLEAWICWPPNLKEIYSRFNYTSYTASSAGN